ncbi:MAG TPA: acyl-CoA dehydrogenase family protein [Acidimicrobiales bacterium]
MTVAPDHDLVTAAADVLGRMGDGASALRALEWTPSPGEGEGTWLPTTLALMRAQGRTLTASPAVAMTRAHVLIPDAIPTDLTVMAGFEIDPADDVVYMVLPADIDDAARVVVDLPLQGLAVVDPSSLSVDGSGVQPLDPAAASRMFCRLDDCKLLPDEAGLTERRIAADGIARFMISAELLGAAEHLMDTAVLYARERIQFGEPIGSFQAVQHMLAEAEAQLYGLRAAIEQLAPLFHGLSAEEADHYVTLLKALAGRTGQRVSQATLQVLGAVGFTWEHEHHRYAKRILTLDALLGSGKSLAFRLGCSALGNQVPRLAVIR